MCMQRYLLLIFSVILAFSMTACEHTVQTTSGASYLSKYKDLPAVAGNNEINIESKLRQVASVEPVLKFPARIGLVRIQPGAYKYESGKITPIPQMEVDAWMELKEKLGTKFGEFVHVNPMVAKMVAEGIGQDSRLKTDDVMNQIRLAAARQHLDAVLIYETYSNTENKKSLLAISDLTIIGGYLLPSRRATAEGFATAMLIDVMQGYPYGTASVTVDKEEVAGTTWGAFDIDDQRKDLADQVESKAAVKLTGEVEKMFRELQIQLDKKQGK